MPRGATSSAPMSLTGLLRPEWRHDGQAPARRDLFEDYFAAHFEEVATCDPLDQATYVDIKTWLPDGVLVKADRTSMAHSLEVRCPLLDYRIVEFAAQLPPEMKLRGFSKNSCSSKASAPVCPRGC